MTFSETYVALFRICNCQLLPIYQIPANIMRINIIYTSAILNEVDTLRDKIERQFFAKLYMSHYVNNRFLMNKYWLHDVNIYKAVHAWTAILKGKKHICTTVKHGYTQWIYLIYPTHSTS